MTTILVGEHLQADRRYGISVRSDDEFWPWVPGLDRLAKMRRFDLLMVALADHLGCDVVALMADFERAQAVGKLQVVQEAWGGGAGPLARMEIVTEDFAYEAEAKFLREKDQLEQWRADLPRKRGEYAMIRNQLLSAMLARGQQYVCQHPGCTARLKLTIDHIVPLARGGTNALSNLQFMCQPHNSSKGSR